VRIVASAHLRNRLSERGITLDDVHNVLDKPLTTWADPDNQSRVFGGHSISGRMLRVCLVDPTPPNGVEVVKTAFWVDT
jgi:Domain of unknown function (DUF4258)